MSAFKAALGVCGLSQADAAEYLGVSISTIKQWSRGRNRVSGDAWQDLAELHRQITETADKSFRVLYYENVERQELTQFAAISGDLPGNAPSTAGAIAIIKAIQAGFNPK